MDIEGLLHGTRVEATVLETWIEAGWIVPREDAASRFSQVDVARAQLIRDLKHEIGVNDEGIAIILDLIDQIHGLRGRLRELCTALSTQPDAVRAIVGELHVVASARRSDAGSESS
jgi:chaperone modulatory protein CbpM